MVRNSIMGCRWSTTPEEAQNLAAESFLALLGIQSEIFYPSFFKKNIKNILVAGSQSGSPTSQLSENSLPSSTPAVSYVLTPSVHMPEN